MEIDEEARERLETHAREEVIQELMQDAKMHMRKAKAKTVFKRIFFFIILLILVISIGYSTSDYNSYLVHSGLKTALAPMFFKKVLMHL